jgi:pimeloyl-ACP methyl ester carboxylesterase
MRISRLALLLIAAIICPLAGAPAARAAGPTPGPCAEGALPGGALWLICVPASGWNGDVVLWAHGYVAPQEPLQFANLDLPDGTYLPELVQQLGFAFATTSYRSNGLVALDALDDMRQLVAQYRALARPAPASRTYLTGASEGGLVNALLAERSPQLFSGALAACGPVGSFHAQLAYWGDFRLLFDYFFPDVLPGSPIAIPQELIDSWDTVYAPRISDAIRANPVAARELIATARAPIDPADPDTVLATTLSLLWYNVFATNDGVGRLGGNPFDNQRRWYSGSSNDLRLNLAIPRYTADPDALLALAAYETSGRPAIPVVLPHTTRDELIRVDQAIRYWLKARPAGDGPVTPVLVPRYGHCNFTTAELLLSFGLLVLQVTGEPDPRIAAMAGGQLDLGATQAALEQQRALYLAAGRAEPRAESGFQGGRVYLPAIER